MPMAEPARFREPDAVSLDDGLPTPDGCLRARVLDVTHHTDQLFEFSVERDPGFRFQAGEFAMLGCDALLPGERLLMVSTGTGVAPFASVALDPAVYEAFGTVVLVQGCRTGAELQFANALKKRIATDDLVQSFAVDRFQLQTCTSREPGTRQGRVTDLIYSGELFDAMEGAPLDPERDRIMLCGSMAMLKELKGYLSESGFVEGSRNTPGSFVIERAFVG